MLQLTAGVRGVARGVLCSLHTLMKPNQALFCEPTSFSSVHFDIFAAMITELYTNRIQYENENEGISIVYNRV